MGSDELYVAEHAQTCPLPAHPLRERAARYLPGTDTSTPLFHSSTFHICRNALYFSLTVVIDLRKLPIDGHVCWKAIVDYRVLFADQGNKLPFSVCSKHIEVAVCCKRKLPLFIVFRIYKYTVYNYGIRYICCRFTEQIKRKTRWFSLICLPFAHLATAVCRLSVCPFVDEGTNRSYLFANGLNRLNGLAHL
jgi:hypothetical protein